MDNSITESTPMRHESRVKKTFLNARVNLVFYFLTLVLSFFSRKIFLECLGADFLGLTTTLGTMLGFLNLAESGVSSAIAVVLYAPLFNRDKGQINEIVSVLGYLYSIIGKVILGAGAVLSLFFPLIFSDSPISQPIIYLVFLSFLGSALIGYFINYKQVLLAADQRNYVIAAYSQTANMVKVIIQIVLAYHTGNYILWAVIEFSFGIIYALILKWRVNVVYPWLKSEVKQGKELIKRYPRIGQNVRRLFIHRIGGVAYTQVTPFLVYAFASLQTVAYYGNYTLITTKLSTLFGNFLGGSGASVGNLIAENDKQRTLKVYWELMSIRFIFTGVSVFAIYHLLPPFIALWLGKEYIMSQTVLVLVLIAFAQGVIRGVTDDFINAHGLFQDIWAPFVEAMILVGVALLGGSIWGFEGTLLGTIVSSFIIIYIWKPYLLFSKGFKLSIWSYWLEFITYLLTMGVAFFLTSKLIEAMPLNLDIYSNWWSWIMYAVIIVALFTSSAGGLLLLTTKGTRDLCARFIKR